MNICYECFTELCVDDTFCRYDGKLFCSEKCVHDYVREDIERGVLEPSDLLDNENIIEHLFDYE